MGTEGVAKLNKKGKILRGKINGNTIINKDLFQFDKNIYKDEMTLGNFLLENKKITEDEITEIKTGNVLEEIQRLQKKFLVSFYQVLFQMKNFGGDKQKSEQSEGNGGDDSGEKNEQQQKKVAMTEKKLNNNKKKVAMTMQMKQMKKTLS